LIKWADRHQAEWSLRRSLDRKIPQVFDCTSQLIRSVAPASVCTWHTPCFTGEEILVGDAVRHSKTARPLAEVELCVTETVAAIVAAHRAGALSPAQTVARSYLRIRNHNDPAVFISLRSEKEAIEEAESLKAKDARDLPLFGVPVAVKDNI